MAAHQQLGLLDEPTPEDGRLLARLAVRDALPPWTSHRDEPIEIQQSLDRCPDCQAVLAIRERVGRSPWSLIYRLSREQHAEECVARNPTPANIEAAIRQAYERNEPLSTIQALDRLRTPRPARRQP
jgi:hypothetical protein